MEPAIRTFREFAVVKVWQIKELLKIGKLDELEKYKNEIKKMYENNITLKEIAIKYNCSRDTIKRFIVQNDFPERKKINPLYKRLKIEMNNTQMKTARKEFHNYSNTMSTNQTNSLQRSYDFLNTNSIDPYKENQNKRMINNFYSSQKYIRNASPYMTEEEKRLEENLKDKKNWIDKRGFFSSVGHYSVQPHFISNYVQLTPSESPLNHKFRDVEKKKWITQKGFC